MKSQLMCILVLLALIINLSFLYSNDNKVYEFRSMIIEYVTESNSSMMKVNGTEKVWIDEWGNKKTSLKKESTEVSFMGNKSTEEKETLSITDGKNYYEIDLKTKTGTKQNTEDMKMMAMMMAASISPEAIKHKSLKQFVEENGGQWLGQETFLGLKCDVFILMETKQWMYKGIVLKVESNMMGVKTVMEAVKVEENAAIPKDIFNVPKDIELTDAPKFDFDMNSDVD